MNAWEGQVLAIALKELFEAVKTLRLGGDKRELSEVIRDLLSVHPNVTRSQALLDALEAKSAGRPSPDLLIAKSLLTAICKQRLLEANDAAARKGMSLEPPTRPRPGPIPGAHGLRAEKAGRMDHLSIPPPRSRARRRARPGGDIRNPDRDMPRRRAASAIFRTSREGLGRASHLPHLGNRFRSDGIFVGCGRGLHRQRAGDRGGRARAVSPADGGRHHRQPGLR